MLFFHVFLSVVVCFVGGGDGGGGRRRCVNSVIIHVHVFSVYIRVCVGDEMGEDGVLF